MHECSLYQLCCFQGLDRTIHVLWKCRCILKTIL
uniref:Uncharacterized protein n=1 Tax=Arundo donax TaxID=35708 RepID=A0A0A9ASX3_ARUDO